MRRIAGDELRRERQQLPAPPGRRPPGQVEPLPVGGGNRERVEGEPLIAYFVGVVNLIAEEFAWILDEDRRTFMRALDEILLFLLISRLRRCRTWSSEGNVYTPPPSANVRSSDAARPKPRLPRRLHGGDSTRSVDAEQRVAHSYHELVSHLVPRSLDFLDACSQTAWV
jgi:putative component of membrane protein insertase Oxa1/YidC/SpoIIIJ protein YidD